MSEVKQRGEVFLVVPN